MTEKRELPTGVFDSGLGGISVLREMVKILPCEDFIYCGDSANAPFGTKSVEEIRRLTLENVAGLYKKGIKAVVIACNTATSAAITALREVYTDIPVIGIEPALKPAAHREGHPRVILMATPGTVKGEKLHRLMDQYEEEADVTALPCPGLMEYVENGILEGPELTAHLNDLFSACDLGRTDAIVLGCTHYPFLKKAIRCVVGERILLLDGSEGTARELKRRLWEADLLSRRTREGEIIFEMSIPEKTSLCRRLLEVPL